MDSEISWAFSALESCRIRCLYSSSQFIIDLILSEGVEEQEGQTEQVSVNEALAIGFLESREFQAVIDTIDGEEKDTLKSPLAEFCRNYAMYMKGELLRRTSGKELRNPYLDQIEQRLTRLDLNGKVDGFNLYLLGLVLQRKGRSEDAKFTLIRSLKLFSKNWSAWKSLLSLNLSEDFISEHIMQTELKTDLFTQYFMLEYYLKGYQVDKAIQLLKSLISRSPNNLFFLAKSGQCAYMQADFESANRHFQSIIELYPGSLSYLDGYSNLLYIEEKHTELGNLAQLCQEADPFSRETYCITGNYFSAKGRSLKAIELFKKSIFIDDEYQLPWLLLGQELVKLGKSAEGISALYKAADLEPTDYRVWHYLGVAYQQSGMEDDSLYYFRKATELKKNDVQLLLHMSGEFHRRKKFVEASKHLRMAHSINPSASILSHLIGCYLEMEDISNASLHIEEYLNSYSDLSPILDSLFSLAGKMESRGDLEKSSKYFSLCLCDPEREPQCLEALGRIAACLGVDLQSLIRSSDRILDLRDSSRLSYSSLDQDQEQEEEENISNESEDMDMDLSP